MRNVVVYELVSLDGVAESPDRFFGWDDVMDANLAGLISNQDAVILGRRTFDEWAPYWPTSDMQPFASFINSVDKYVVTSSPLSAEWTRTTVVEGDLAAFVRELKTGSGRDIGVHASISVAQTLLAAGLVDEIRLVIAPAVVGQGRRLFDDPSPTELELIRSERSTTGHLMADYRVVISPG